jgi:neurobeachin-like protein 1/2
MTAACRTRRRLLAVGSAWSPAVDVTPRLFAVTPDAKLVYFGGNWDNSIRVYSIARSRQTAYAIQHTG